MRGGIFILSLQLLTGGCATIRVTDPAQAATEQFLRNVASNRAIDQLSIEPLRDHKVYIDSTYLITVSQWPTEYSYLIGELRAKLLLGGVRLAERRDAFMLLQRLPWCVWPSSLPAAGTDGKREG